MQRGAVADDTDKRAATCNRVMACSGHVQGGEQSLFTTNLLMVLPS